MYSDEKLQFSFFLAQYFILKNNRHGIIYITKKIRECILMKKIISMLIAISMLVAVSACGNKANEQVEDGKVVLKVDCWPDKAAKPEDYESMMKVKAEFEAKYPDIIIEPDTYRYSVDTFLAKAAANQLPNLVSVPFTEIDKIVDAGYAADLTSVMDEYGYTENLADNIKEMVTRDSKIYMVPTSAYVLGLMANKNVFEEAGELDENGLINYPDTFEELGELAGRIKEKTGKAGFIMPTTKNVGGWHFMNIAWAYGTEFMAQENGKWVAKFASPECEAALQFVKDLKWKYDALSDNMFVDNAELYKMLATEQGAMCFSDPSQGTIRNNVKNLGMDPEAISVGKIPAGSKGQFALMGGNLYMVTADSDEKLIDAAFKWLDFRGMGAKFTDEAATRYENDLKSLKEQEIPVVGKTLFSIWKQGEIVEKRDAILAEYGDLNIDLFKEYMDLSDVTIKAEEPVCCQDLYALLDNCIQAVIEDKDADVHQLLVDAANDFQINYLDNLE